MSFRKEFISGTLYTAIAKYATILISIVISAVLSRLLPPTAFGTIAIATIFIGFLTIFTSSGLSPAIIQDRTLSIIDLRYIFSFTFYLAIATAFLVASMSTIIASIYENTVLIDVCLLLTIFVFFSIINVVPNALLFKNKRFRYIACRTLVVNIFLGVVSVIGALWGMGVYALLINPIGSSIIIFILSYRCYPVKFSLYFKIESVKRILPFSFFQICFNILNYCYRNVDKMLIGRFIGMAQLGYYDKSYRLMMMPLENISNVITPVMLPLLSEHQDSHQFIFDKYKTIIRYFGYIGFIISAICFCCAREIILLIFGNQWEASIPVFRIFSLSIGIQLVQSAVGAIFQSTGNVKKMFVAGCWSFGIMIVAISIGLYQRSIELLAYYVVLAFYIIFFIYHYYLISVVMKKHLFNFCCMLIKPLITGIIITLVLVLVSILLNYHNLIVLLSIKLSVSLVLVIVLQKCKLIVGLPTISQLICKIIRKP